jgi:phosphate transport system protein
LPREIIERKLQSLQDDLLVLGSLVEKALSDAVNYLRRRDIKNSQRLIVEDRIINERRYALESDTLAVIATQQPMAIDLRALASILEIATELERMGDYAKGIARINLMLGEGPLLRPLNEIPDMLEQTEEMLHQALDAFVRRDVDLARQIPAMDDEVDALYNKVYRDLIDLIVADHGSTEQANLLLWVAHNLERTADRVTNICERTVFTVTGQAVEMDLEEQLESIG